ncbi:MAG TPA: catechol 2,3-dioxygenase [Actinomycetes bacterium]|nr:catechol 2,3-dioxygenase [Actinomycetes bacterium]
MGILRISHVEVRVPDLDLATAYYTQVLGLIEVERQPGSVYLKCWDETDHHSLVLTYHPRHGLNHMSFRVEAEDDLAELERALETHGCAVRRRSAGEELAVGQAIRFETPSGHEMELVHRMERVGGVLPMRNPPPTPHGLAGIHPPRMDHLLVTAEEVGDAARFYTDVLGFRLTERLLDGHGHQIGVWLERSHSPHDLAVVSGPNGGLHHFAFWLDDWDEVRRAADILAYHGVQIDVGPTRHGITRGETVYFFDPVGNRNEVFTGGYRPDPDFEPITWTEDQIGRAIFYYEQELNDRFMTVHS